MKREVESYLVVSSPPQHYAWLKRRTSCELTDGFRAIEAREPGEVFCRLCGEWHGRIRGMVGYTGWQPNSVAMHVAVDTVSAALALRGPAFAYPFVQCGKGLVIGVTPGDNVRALRLNRHLGLKEVFRVPDAWSPGVDDVVQVMRREDCRWIRGIE